MATKPGVLTNWPWKSLGNFKYVILAPWVVHSSYSLVSGKGEEEEEAVDIFYLLIFPFLLARILHNQIWISYSRYRTAKGNNRIVDKGIEFDQVDRERNWDDAIILGALISYSANMTIPGASHLPLWRTDGIIITVVIHTGPVEFLYYWFHRALHHHYLYSRYHSHHHSSIVTEPITAVIHPFAEEVAYYIILGIPLFTMAFTGTASLVAVFGYVTYIDFMNNMGHCNFELVPKRLYSVFPPLKYLLYTPSYHSLHHTQFRTNYSLFMPVYDYIYGTMDKSTDALFESSLKRKEESPDVVYLTHLTSPNSIYHLPIGFASLASKPSAASSKWYLVAMWPVTKLSSMFLTWIYGRTFISERNAMDELKIQSWVVPRFTKHYLLGEQKEDVNKLIEEAILEADKKGAKVFTLGLLNQNQELNWNGELYIQSYPKLKIKLVDGSSLAAAVVVNSIPQGTTQILLIGKFSKVSYAIALALCQKGVKVATINMNKYKEFEQCDKFGNNLVIPDNYNEQKIWLVGEGFTETEQLKAAKGTLFIPFSQFPPKKVRKDCYYHTTPAMVASKSLENLHTCDNWLARRVMSAWRVAGIVHGLEGWNVHEYGQTMFSMEKIWKASLDHGFRPVPISN